MVAIRAQYLIVIASCIETCIDAKGVLISVESKVKRPNSLVCRFLKLLSPAQNSREFKLENH